MTATTSPTQPKRSTRSLFSKPSSNTSSWVRKQVDTSFLQSRTFGRPNRPSTPIYGVMTGQYQRDWEAEQVKAQQRRDRAALKKVKAADVKAQHTLASLGHMKVERQPSRERFVMQRFTAVDKKIVTRWEQRPARRGAVAAAAEQKPSEEHKEQITA